MYLKKNEKIKVVLGKNILSILKYTCYHTEITVFVLKKVDYRVLEETRKLLSEEHFILLLEDDVVHGVDVFPLDFLHIKDNSEVLEGEDYFSGMKVDKKHVRFKLEFELRNKLIYLREQYLRASKRRKFLTFILPAFVILLEGSLFLKNLKKGGGLLEDLKNAEKAYDVKLSVFKKLYEHERKKTDFGKDEVTGIIQHINDEMRELMEKINQLKI